MTLIREDQADITVFVNNVQYGDSWNGAEGGDLESDSQKGRAGGMGDEVSAGGPSSRTDLELTIQFSDLVATWHDALELAVRYDYPVKVVLNWLNRDRTPNGRTTTRTGTAKAARLPTTTGNAVGTYTFVVDCDEVALNA